MPATLNCWYLGMIPIGESSPCGLMIMMVDPTVAPIVSAKSFPSTTGGKALPVLQASSAQGSRGAADPSFMDFSSSLTRFSYFGITPFNSAPLARAEREAST